MKALLRLIRGDIEVEVAPCDEGWEWRLLDLRGKPIRFSCGKYARYRRWELLDSRSRHVRRPPNPYAESTRERAVVRGMQARIGLLAAKRRMERRAEAERYVRESRWERV